MCIMYNNDIWLCASFVANIFAKINERKKNKNCLIAINIKL